MEEGSLKMLKIKNPISRSRFTFEEQLQRKLTFMLTPLIRAVGKMPYEKILNNRLFQFYKHGLEENIFTRKYTNEQPSNVEVDLVSINIGELLPIEEIDSFRSGMLHIYRYFGRDGYQPLNDFDRVMKFCDEVEENLHGRSWSNLGSVLVKKDSDLHKYIKRISFSASQISTSSVLIIFNVTPADEFLESLKELMKKEIKGEIIFTTSLKDLFKSAAAKNYSSSQVKQRLIEDYLIEIKWRLLSEIGQYFSLYFYKNEIMPPNIEIYKTNQIYNNMPRIVENDKVNEFWESVGMDKKGLNTEISNDGFLLLHSDSRSDNSLDNKIKIVGNSNVSIQPGYDDFNIFLTHYLEEFSLEALSINVINTYADFVNKQLASYQRLIYQVTQKRKLKYKKIIKIRHTLHQNIQILKRFKNEISNEDFERKKQSLRELTANFEIALSDPSRLIDYSWTNRITRSTIFLINETYNHSENLTKLLEDTVQLVEIGTNRSLRNWSFRLSMFTVFLTIITTILATTSIALTYFQLAEETQNVIKNFFSSIWNYI